MTVPFKSANQPFYYVKQVTGFILLLLLAAVFLFSGYSKIYSQNSFDAFQWTFLDLGIKSITLAGIIARVLIGFEFLLGGFLLFHIFLRSFTYKAVITLLIIFTCYLILVIIQQGNTGNCGCFGTKVSMTPLQSIYKNLLMLAVTFIVMRIYPGRPYKNQEWISALLGMAALVTPFIINPLTPGDKPQVTSEPINLAPLYKYSPAPDVDLKKDKHIVSFMSLTCPHCRKAAYLIQIIHKQHPSIPFYMVLNGSSIHINDFFKETHSIGVPHIIFDHEEEFIQMAGSSVPAIFWINNSVIERKSNYEQLDPKNMMDWLKK